MKLAEGLIARADLQSKVAQLKNRMAQNVKVEEGEEPMEKIEELFQKYGSVMAELEMIIMRINRTNATVRLDNGTLADAIAKRDCLKLKISTFRDLIEMATVVRERSYRSDKIIYTRCIDTSKLRKKADDLAKEYRALDTKMQGLNWNVDLCD